MLDDLTWPMYALGIAGGFLAGVINTLAGNGSAITLSLLIFFGLPADVANGTNRIGVLAQTGMASAVFYKKGQIDFKQNQWIIWPCFLGAILGVWVANQISPGDLEWIIGALMILLLVVIVINPKKWIVNPEKVVVKKSKWFIPGFFLLGFYGGFIQMGMGIFFLALMVLGANYDLIRSNILKSLIVFLYTIFVLGYFICIGKINWLLGGLLAIGQVMGGWVGARFAVEYPRAEVWIHRLLILVIIAAVIRLFGIHQFILLN